MSHLSPLSRQGGLLKTPVPPCSPPAPASEGVPAGCELTHLQACRDGRIPHLLQAEHSSGAAGVIHQRRDLEGKPDSSARPSRTCRPCPRPPSPTSAHPFPGAPRPPVLSLPLHGQAELPRTTSLVHSKFWLPQFTHCLLSFLDAAPAKKKHHTHTHHSFPRKILNSGVLEEQRFGGNTPIAPP